MWDIHTHICVYVCKMCDTGHKCRKSKAQQVDGTDSSYVSGMTPSLDEDNGCRTNNVTSYLNLYERKCVNLALSPIVDKVLR